jgi:proteasome lid subunit RPN8/RPN11
MPPSGIRKRTQSKLFIGKDSRGDDARLFVFPDGTSRLDTRPRVVPDGVARVWQETPLLSSEKLELRPVYKYRLRRFLRKAQEIRIPKKVLDAVVSECWYRFPEKAYGALHGKEIPEAHRTFQTNIRDRPPFKQMIERHGEFYEDPDAGFVVDSKEQLAFLEELDERKHKVFGVFHSHRLHSAEPTQTDLEMHFDPNAYAIIVSLQNPSRPVVRAFKIVGGKSAELRIRLLKEGFAQKLAGALKRRKK